MRVQFVWFNLNCTPKMNIGVALLARELTEAGHQVSVLHLNEQAGLSFDLEEIQGQIRSLSPDLLALSFGRNHLRFARELCAELGRVLPGIPVLCGGIHPTLFPDQVIEMPGVDYLCLGEADGRMVPFVDCLARGGDPSDMAGFWGKSGGGVWRNHMPDLPDIRNQTWIDLDSIDHGPSLDFNRGMFEVVTGRGCPNRCSFCFNLAIRDAYRGHIPEELRIRPYCRKRDVANLLGEMEMIRDRFGERLKMFSLADDAVNFDPDWMMAFCNQYAERIDLPYTCNLLADGISDELAGALARSRAIAKIGVESGSERIRKEILGKTFDESTFINTVARLKDCGVPTRIYLMVGNPHETRDEILATFRFAARLAATSTRLCIFFPVEGTPIHDRCRRDGLLTGREYENYDDLSVLKWEPGMALFIDKVHLVHPWMQNVYMNESCASEYGPLLGKVMAMSADEWSQEGTRRWVRSVSLELTRKLRAAAIEHYFNPFPERPDVTFLYTGEPVGLPNADEIPDEEPRES